MIFYIFLLIICTILYIINSYNLNNYQRKVSAFILFFLLLIISATRINIGIDYYGHWSIYNELMKGNYKVSIMEPFYLLACLVGKYSGLKFYFVIAIFSFITLYPIYKISMQENNFLLFFMYFLVMYLISFSLIRQYSAISLAIYGTYLYCKQNEKKKAYIFFVCAGLIHTSLFIYLFLFFVARYIRLNKTVLIILALIVFITCVETDFFIRCVKFIAMGTKYEWYITYSTQDYTKTKLGTGLGVLLRYINYFCIIYLNDKRSEKKDKYSTNTLFLFLFLFDALSLRIQIFLRLRYVLWPVYFTPFLFFKISHKKSEFLNIKNIIIVFIIFSNILFFPATTAWGNIPYQNLFFK